jgi:2-keto-4-pentenoate hydratase/2-oxohepta-3-ene-1,7-dioic acid hydratase in catechol pathway
MRLFRLGLGDDSFWALGDNDAEAGRAWRIRNPFEHWAPRLAAEGAGALDLAPQPLRLVDHCLLPPLEPGARVFGVGLNYLAHLQRLGSQAPAHPLAYIKPASALVGALDPIAYPPMTAALDYEVELVAVMAAPLAETGPASASVLGYTLGNDTSARDAGKQIGRLDLLTQKAMDRTTPVGPCIVTAKALGVVGQPALDFALWVNGEQRQADNTGNMIFTLDELLNYLDARIALRPGDMVFTGSSHGVGLEDGRFLRPGDLVRASIKGIGELCNRITPPRQLSPDRALGRLGGPEHSP